MFRRLFILLTLLSSLLLAATLALWFRSRNGGNDTLTLRTARTYAGAPALKWVVVETYDGLVISLQRKIVPSVYDVAPPWREDVPIAAAAGHSSYDGPVTVNFGTYGSRRTMDVHQRAEYEALVTPEYVQMPWFRWQSGPRTAFRNPAPVHPMLERLGIRRFAPYDGLVGREGYPGTYRDHRFRLPFILPVIASSVLLLCWLPVAGRRLRARNRLRASCCPACGYDLQKTPWVCPECGRTRVPGEGRRARQDLLLNLVSSAIERLGDRRERIGLALRAAVGAAALVGCIVLLRSPVVAGAGAPTVEGRHLRRELDRQRLEIADEIERLRAAGDAVVADRVAEELRTAGRGADVPRHLHVVSLQQFTQLGSPIGHPSEQRPRGVATVHVTATGRPILLALCSSEPVHWDLRVRSGVRLERILLEGGAKQHVTGVPPGVPVQDSTAAAGNTADYVLASEYDPAYRWETRQLLRQRTGVRARTFQARRYYGGTPFIVGPGSADWEVQSELANLRPLYTRVAALQRERARLALGPLRFRAIWTEPVPVQSVSGVVVVAGAPPSPVPLISRGWSCFAGSPVERSLVEFDLAGPVVSTKRTLPQTPGGAKVDASRATWCGAYGGVITFDARTGDLASAWPDDIAPVGGVALDPRRRRLMFIRGESERVHTFDIDTGNITPRGNLGMNRQRMTPLTYSDHDDCFYALTEVMAHVGIMTMSVTRLSPDGVPEWQVPIPERVGTQILGPPQLAAAGRYLAILTPPIPDPLDPDAPLAPRCVLFDPWSRSVVYSGTIEPHDADPSSAPATTGRE